MGDGDCDCEGEEGKNIDKWQDWYALGQLMFHFHQIVPPDGETGNDDKIRSAFSDCKDYWLNVNEDVETANRISELKELLTKLDENNWKIQLRRNFDRCVKRSMASHQVRGRSMAPR